VLFRREALQHRIARVDDEGATPSLGHGADEIAHEAVLLDLVDADAVLHRHRGCYRLADAPHAVGNKARLRHQAGAERAALHAFARAADVEVDFVVAILLAELRAARKLVGLAAAELERHRMLCGTEGEMPL